MEKLLQLNQNVIGLDNLSTGYMHNLNEVKLYVSESQWSKFSFVNGDISRIEDCKNVTKGVDHVLHQAALGSVPRSIEDPIQTNQSNINGFLNILVASKDADVSSFTYAASSSTYGIMKLFQKSKIILEILFHHMQSLNTLMNFMQKSSANVMTFTQLG